MLEHNLREELIKIELAVKKNELDFALNLFEKINQNWEEYKKGIKQEEIKALIKLSEYIEKLLLEKKKNFFDRKKLFQLRKAYSKF
ncbi:MAG: hypothetical protein H0Z16_00885 [Thermodesulfobacterium sp.]|nr:hypothetical protein [Thermodesulfobacterium sp.]